MRIFLVERFTALSFWLLFSQVKSNIKEKGIPKPSCGLPKLCYSIYKNKKPYLKRVYLLNFQIFYRIFQENQYNLIVF